MVFIGDYFAIALVLILCLFYFDGIRSKYFITQSSKYFIFGLAFTLLTATLDILSVVLVDLPGVPLWLNVLMNSLYFIVNILTTSCIALFLFSKILEHSYDEHCMVYAKRGLMILFGVFSVFVVANIWTGWVFYFENGAYYRGPLNCIGYVITLCQMGLVLVCYFRNRRNASSTMRKVLIQAFPIAVLCIILQQVFPDILLNGLIMATVDTILLLTFQGERDGVHNLTKLNDRHRFFRDVENRLDRDEKLQIFLINIKNFSKINQKFGNRVGDEVLYEFAFTLERLIKNSMAFHMNGTTFALTVPYTSQGIAEEYAGKLIFFLDEGIYYNGTPIHFDSVLVEYVSVEDKEDSTEIYEKLEYAASIAYQKKNRYIRYTPDMADKMRRVHYLIERLEIVDRCHGFEVWFQPIRCLNENRFCSMEALVRLREKNGSLISPAEFIPIAEKMGMITPITWFVLDESCRLISENPILKDITVAINIPMNQLMDRGFVTRFNSIVDRYNIPHEKICLEFTERALLENFEKTKNIMEVLNESGYRFYLDDFGTGYSNFSCMLQLPFQFIKLDSSLTRIKEATEDHHKLVKTLTHLFHDMNLKVIAEGAETDEEVATIASLGVDRIQGFALAKPMPVELLLEFYEKENK